MADHVDIDPHGRIVPRDEAARRALADRAGRFQLLPSTPDLLVARRTPVAGGASPTPRCLVAGDLSGFPVPDFVAFVHQSRLSGLLTVGSGGADRALSFQDGEVRGARSEADGERIAEVAIRLGYLGPDALSRAGLGKTAPGKALVDRHLLAPADHWKCLREQVAVVFDAVLLAREGVFTFAEDPDQELGSGLAMSTQSLLMDGMRRLDERTLFRARIPGPDAYLRRRQPRVPVTLQPLEQDLLQLVDGRRRVSDIAQAAHLGEFDAVKLLHHLAEVGYLEAVAEPAATAGASLPERVAAIAAGMNAVLQLITAELAAAGAIDPFLAGVRSALSDPTSRYAPLWRELAPNRDGSIDAQALAAHVDALPREELARLEPSVDPARYLLQGLRELMFLYLFLAGERIPRAADERMHAEVKRRCQALGEGR